LLLLVAAAAPNLWVLIGALGLVGLCSLVAQILVPMAAQMASPEARGKVVGTVMTGLLLGIMLARTVSGLIAGALGWRAVFVVAATLAAALGVVLGAELPRETRRSGLSYAVLMRSLVTLARERPELRRTAAVGALVFACFSAFWTTIAFRLSDPPFDYGDAAIGLLGLAGVAGALCAAPAGRTSDRGWGRPARMVSMATLAMSFAVLWFGRSSIAWIVVGVILLDVGVQGTQVLNQSVIYGLSPSAQSRVNSVYKTTYFVGGAGGSTVAGAAYNRGGWGAVCILGASMGALALLLAAPATRATAGQRAQR
jgi:predicted MFS family arabinose efflux permease